MNTNGGSDGSIDIAALSERLQNINRVVRQAQAQKAQASKAAPTATSPIAESKSDKGDLTDTNTIATAIKDDSNGAASDASESKVPAIDELTLEDENDDENRNKR